MTKRRKYLLIFLIILISFAGGIHNFIYTLRGKELGLKNLGMYVSERRGYAAAASQVAQGNILPTEYCLFEYKNIKLPYTWPPLSTLILGFFTWLFGDVRITFIFLDFFLPPLIFYLTYILFRKYILAKPLLLYLAILASTHTNIFSQIMPAWILNTSFLNRQWPKFTRLHAPALTNLFCLLGAWSILRLSYKFNLKSALVAGILCGISIYVYYHLGIFLIICLGLCLGYQLGARLSKNNFKIAKENFKIFFVALTILTLIITPFLINAYFLMRSSWFSDFLLRTGVEFGREFRTGLLKYYLAWSLIPLFAFLLLQKKKTLIPENPFTFILIVCFSFLVSINFHMILGKFSHPRIFIGYIFVFPLSLIIILLLDRMFFRYKQFFKLVGKYSWIKLTARLLLALFILSPLIMNMLSSLALIYNQKVIFSNISQTHLQLKFSAEAINWLNKNAPRDSVVLSFEPLINIDILIDGNFKLYLPFGEGTIASNNEIRERFLTASRLVNVSENDLNDLFDKLTNHLFHFLFYPRIVSMDSSGGVPVIPFSYRQDLLKDYLFLKSDHIYKDHFRLDYVIMVKKYDSELATNTWPDGNYVDVDFLKRQGYQLSHKGEYVDIFTN